ncbi:CDK-activating kinase assembly factor MAT1 [Chlorella vulgaris]
MEPSLRKEMQIRARIESIFNKRLEDFATRQEYDDYLEEREDIIFNLVEGLEVKEMEAKVDNYRRLNADSIIKNEALRAEELRQRVAAAEEGAGQAGVSGTAAAFKEGTDAEPYQGMEYTAALPEMAAAALTAGVAPVPLGPAGTDGNFQAAARQPTGDAWLAMALSSGWTQDMPKKKALEQAFGSVLVF